MFKILFMRHTPSTWVPSLYLAEALPYTAVMLIALVMYKDFGLSDSQITLYTGWLSMPWVIKPVWCTVVDNLRTKRWWILTMQFVMGTALALVAFALHVDFWLQISLALFMLIAFSSATHDISADGFYIIALNEQEQSAFVGIRNTFYRVGMIAGQGGLVALAGVLGKGWGNIPALGSGSAWGVVFLVLSVFMFLLAVVHTRTLPDMEQSNHNNLKFKEQMNELWQTLLELFRKPHLWSAIAFILLFRLPEGLLTKMVPLFMKADPAVGGLGMDNVQLGFVNGTLGVIGLLLGGILGGFLVARYGLRRCIWPLVLCFTVPDVVYLLLSLHPAVGLTWVGVSVFFEQMGYGLGFAAYTIFLLNFARGRRSTAIFSICTAGQLLGGSVIPGMISGWISDSVGYTAFFTIVMFMCIATFLVTAFAHIADHS